MGTVGAKRDLSCKVDRRDKSFKAVRRRIGSGDISMDFFKIMLTAALFAAGPAWAGDLTGPQNNAVRSAKQYLSMAGFSRSGLIHQLSSDAGEGFDVSDATIAVDSMNIDWNQEAVKSAKQYLNMMGFSCKGLIKQLSSSAGEKYTVDQATYGAKHADGC
jgi:hypothetical protein